MPPERRCRDEDLRTARSDGAAFAGRRPAPTARGPRTRPEPTKSIFCVHMMAAPRQSPPPEEPAQRPRRRVSSCFLQPAQAGTRARPEERKRGHVGRISSVFWITTGCATRNSAARRPTLRFGPRRPTRKRRPDRQRGQHQRQAPAKGQEAQRALEGLVDREPAKKRRQRKVIPGRVVLEEVPVGKQAPEHAPRGVRVLESSGSKTGRRSPGCAQSAGRDGDQQRRHSPRARGRSPCE
jgi:hypothetical protein